MGTIGIKFGQKLSRVGTIGAQIGPSGYYRGWVWVKIEQSGHYREWIWAKMEQGGHHQGPISGQVGTIGGPRVDLDTLSKGENGRFLDTVDKIEGSGWQFGPSSRSSRIRPEAPYRNIEIDVVRALKCGMHYKAT